MNIMQIYNKEGSDIHNSALLIEKMWKAIVKGEIKKGKEEKKKVGDERTLQNDEPVIFASKFSLLNTYSNHIAIRNHYSRIYLNHLRRNLADPEGSVTIKNAKQMTLCS